MSMPHRPYSAQARAARHHAGTLAVITLLQVLTVSVTAQDHSTVTVESCYLRILEQAQVPALNRGVLQQVAGTEGAYVEPGDTLATLDDAEARIAVEVARLELAAVLKRSEDAVDIEIATAAVEEARQLLQQARITSRIARQQAQTDTALRQAVKARDLAQANLNRAFAARKEFEPSVSDAELERLQLERDSSELSIEKARDDLKIAGIRTDVEGATVLQQESAVRRLEFQLLQARTEATVSDLTVRMKREALALAEEQLRRRQVVSPLTGMIVEQMRFAGEWVEPGETVFRVVRLDQLMVEGHVDAAQLDQSARGRPVEVSTVTEDGTVTVTGRVTFVSPEVDPVNQQVQVKAQIKNSKLKLRPGLPVQMKILPQR